MTISPSVRHISKCFIKPNSSSQESEKPYHLTPWDIAMLSANYIQKGLLFPKPNQTDPILTIINHLKLSLSKTLIHFYPLTGRLFTEKTENPPSYSVSVTFNNSPGAEFIHAATDITINDLLSSIDVPTIVNSFFDLTGALNHDGHTNPLLSVQVTELLDGIFVGCCINHVIADGTSYWSFFNAWSEISRKGINNSSIDIDISRPPILERWFIHGQGPILNLPFSHHDEFLDRYVAPLLRERIFHFSPESMARLKAKANTEYKTTKISSFQALSAMVWRSITRVRQLPGDQKTSCRMAINSRLRLNPPLSQDYFGNCIYAVSGTCTAGELLSHDLGWAAWKLHEAVAGHTDGTIREWLEAWKTVPFVYQMTRFFDPYSVMMGSSPRFEMYGNDFGWGKAVGVRSGYANKFSGKVSSYPGREGGGSVDLEVCLPPEMMTGLESEEEFMDAVSSE